jgi:hypothetical protein
MLVSTIYGVTDTVDALTHNFFGLGALNFLVLDPRFFLLLLHLRRLIQAIIAPQVE